MNTVTANLVRKKEQPLDDFRFAPFQTRVRGKVDNVT